MKYNQFACIVLTFVLLWSNKIAARTVVVPNSSRSLNKALVKSRPGDTLLLEPGVYRGKIIVPPRVSLVSKELHKAKINGVGASKVVTLINGSSVYGLTVYNGRVGVYSEGIDNKIIGCKISNNSNSGILAVANFPKIEDNVIYRNLGSGITLWDTNSDTTGIDHNTIVYNGNHGISIGGSSKVWVKNNIIAFNQKLKIKAEDSVTVYEKYNDYYFNIELNGILPEDNYSFDPRFKDPLTDNFMLSDSSRCINSGEIGSDIGSEIFTNFKY